MATICRLMISLLAIAVSFGAGCRKEEEPAVKPAKVEATEAYITHFGPPPTVREGECFAMVGYLPARQQPGKVLPFPLFTFSRDRSLELLAARISTMDPEVVERAGMVNPFPPGSEIRSLTREGEWVRVELYLPDPATGDLEMMFASLGHSLVQFPGVEGISVTGPGLPTRERYRPEPAAVEAPGPPILLQVLADWPEGSDAVNEISLYFDRPLRQAEARIIGPSEEEIKGEWYRSVFDMALVLHAKERTVLAPETLLQIDWDAVDHLDRSSRGTVRLPLRQAPHP